MIKGFLKKFNLLIVSVLCFILLLTSCSLPKDTVNVPQQNTPSPTPTVAGGTPVSRYDEIFDANKFKGQFTMRFFNIDVDGSSGDSMLLQAPDGTTMLIDAGLAGSAQAILDGLKKIGIPKLDYAVATHMHIDHIGGFNTILNTIPVDKMLMSSYTDYSSGTAKSFNSTVKAKNIETEYIKEGDTFQFGKDIKVEVLNPEPSSDYTIPENSQNFLNDNSIVLKMTYKNRTFLFAADIQIPTEQRLVEKYKDNIDVDFLKVPHHGSITSSGMDFIETLSPSIAMITCNSLKNINVYDKLKKSGSKVYLGGLDGIVLVASDGENINVVTERDRKPGAVKP